MNTIKSKRSPSELLSAIAILVLTALWLYAIFIAPTDRHQGDVYRILYMHVPVAFTAFASALFLLVVSLRSLFSDSKSSENLGKACAEVGLIFTCLTLASGAIWGKPTWGTWWTWDARLTTTFLLALLYAGYLLLASSLDEPAIRRKVLAALGVVIFINVPIIYKSVQWWRTLHQPQSITVRNSTMSPDMMAIFFPCMVATIVVGICLIFQRAHNMKLADELEAASFEKMRQS